MPLLLSSRTSARGQSPDTHGMAAASQVTWALFAPSGVLCTGKGQGDSWVSPKLHLLSCQAALPESCPQLREHLYPAGEPYSPVQLYLQASPRFTPAMCPLTAPSAPRNCRKRRNSIRPHCPAAHGQRQAPAQPCPVRKDTGARRNPMEQYRGTAQALAPSVLL